MTLSPESLRNRLSKSLPTGLRLRARELANGVLTGGHRATRRGAGIEFAEHRAYTPGDDLRHLDSHALLRHGRLLIRQFQSETERVAYIICDASPSMAYRGITESAPSKAETALLLSAALCYVTQRGGDALALSLITEKSHQMIPSRGGAANLSRALDLLENADIVARNEEAALRKKGSKSPKEDAPDGESFGDASWTTLLDYLTTRLPSGSVVFVISDFLQLTPKVAKALAGLASRNRTVRAIQVLTPAEVDFPFDGPVRFIEPESGRLVQTDASTAKQNYKSALAALTAPLEASLKALGGQFVRVTTSDDLSALLPSLVFGAELSAALSGKKKAKP